MRRLVVRRQAREKVGNYGLISKENFKKVLDELMSVEGTTDKHKNGHYILWVDLRLGETFDVEYIVTDNQVTVIDIR